WSIAPGNVKPAGGDQRADTVDGGVVDDNGYRSHDQLPCIRGVRSARVTAPTILVIFFMVRVSTRTPSPSKVLSVGNECWFPRPWCPPASVVPASRLLHALFSLFARESA